MAAERRLLDWARPARTYVVIAAALGVMRALLIIAQAWLLATIIAGGFLSEKDLAELRRPMEALAVVLVLRAVVAWSSEWAADRCGAQVKSLLRIALMERAAVLGPDGQPVGAPGRIATLATRGIDALDPYFTRYLPQRLLAVVVPVATVAATFTADWISALIMVVTLPLIPVFMALIGMATRAQSRRQFRTLELLSGHFLDVVRGLTTLKIFGRSEAQVEVIEAVTTSYRKRLAATLRVTFLSSLVLELAASVSVALIAVSIGLRLLDGHIELRAGLFVLVLAPETYLPLRQLGAEFHASAEGVAAAEEVFDAIDLPRPVLAPAPAGAGLARRTIFVDEVCFTYPDRHRPALDRVSFEIRSGEIVALSGPSGCGKSTLLAVLLGLIQPDAGAVRVGDVDLATVDPDSWRAQVAWVPQTPHIFAATIADNIRLGREASDADVAAAAAAAGLAEMLDRLPDGLVSFVGERGAGLSAGERQRLGLARAFLREVPLLLLDEPTASLDGRTEAQVLDAVRRLSTGRTVVLAAHRQVLLDQADRVVELGRIEVAA